MKKFLFIFAFFFLISTLIFIILYIEIKEEVYLTLSITFGITAYHFIMRLSVGLSINAIFKNKIRYDSFWFKEKKFEEKLYISLRVKKRKKLLPTYEKSYFDLSKHSLSEVAGAMAQAEIIHEIIAVLSFLPIFLSIWFNAWGATISTSIIMAIFDLLLVIIQRYNRARTLKLINRMKNN